MAVVRLRPSDLRAAIDGDALSLHYLPQVSVSAGRLDGVECFVRWPHPSLGLVGPADIAELVRQTGLHAAFDAWVAGTAAAQLARWRGAGVVVPLAAISVWAESLNEPSFRAAVAAAVATAAAASASLELKCPRGVLGDRVLASTLGGIAALGARLAIDALAPGDAAGIRFDTLKVPASIVHDMPGSASVVRAIAVAAIDRGARVVAEGVETPEQQEMLVGLGCDVVQGYLYGPEVSADEIAALVVPGAA